MRCGSNLLPPRLIIVWIRIYCLLGLQSKVCLEGALNFALCGSLTECSHDPDKFFLQRTVFPG
jgi:hypothetical protein